MAAEAPPALTPKQKRTMRTGTCVAPACPERCEFFALEGYMDGWPMCACGHTQDSHRFIKPTTEGKVDA